MDEPNGVSNATMLHDEEVERQAVEGQHAREAADAAISRVESHLERMARALERIATTKGSPAWEEVMRERRDD
jgi:hypothetical protein